MRISDLHTHPALKPFHNQKDKENQFQNIWNGVRGVESYFHKLSSLIKGEIEETARDSQSHLNEFVAGDIGTAAFVIHPVERGWFQRPSQNVRWFKKLLLRLALSRNKVKYLAASLTGIPLEETEKYLNEADGLKPVDYYESETFPEYNYINSQQQLDGSWEFNFKIVDSYQAYKDALGEKTIPAFMCIEGGHSLTKIVDGNMFRKEYDQLNEDELSSLEESLNGNIARIKGLGEGNNFQKGHTPIYVTLCHMYQNFLSGHSRSYKQGNAILPGMEDLLEQSTGLNTGITTLGWKAIASLTSNENGNRILIDVKHMSVKGRSEYYEYAEKHGLPIIASHIAMSGVTSFPDYPKDRRKDNDDHYFSKWSINLSDEDVKIIDKSNGLIGIALHEGRMPGGKALKAINDVKKKIQKGRTVDQQLKTEYIKLIMSNILQIVQAIGSKSAWDRLMIGSDYDGIMNPFDIYPKSSYFKSFIYDMKEYLDKPFPLITYKNGKETVMSVDEIKKYMYGLTAEEISKKIAIENFEAFIEKNY